MKTTNGRKKYMRDQINWGGTNDLQMVWPWMRRVVLVVVGKLTVLCRGACFQKGKI
jgi:hypothetical protein